ncbi:DnaJ domain-containing protein [Desulfosoma caldarium]|uniref:DnaJ-like protein n=1 Tax=Desulfosoma caldarium TaxID=610254 RepID=A0A3N1VQZ0_9BACT|nr:DnaJ domain-containing protein [Desulfosoma caldarium]ROR03491.1 DnaJ-like protein [Desulfosoma caldarium]
MRECYYSILGVSTKASQEEIKGAFRRQALRWHPDVNPGCAEVAEKFRRVLDAYEVLSDPEKRRLYDQQCGYTNRSNGTRQSVFHWSWGMAEAVSEVFQDLLGGAPRHDFYQPRVDLRYDLEIPRNKAISGTQEKISYERSVFCPECAPNGHGTGTKVCQRCGGSGEILELCTVTVAIPAGCVHEMRLRIPAAGDRFRPGGPAGDLVIVCHVVEG